jgi:NAD(P)-dependent dehydrogenase (short-subunit alcohol dehydrogenase family)
VALALVVGGASGIGAAVVDAHHARGDTVVVWDRNPDAARLSPEPAALVACDVRDDAAVATRTEELLATRGLPSMVTLTAGVGHAGTLLATSRQAWDEVQAVNVGGVVSVLRHLAGALVAAGQEGSFVVTTSVSGTLVDRGMGAYCASKAAADMLVRVAAAELGEHGIRVNAVAPGVTRTPMVPVADDTPWLTAVRQRTALGRTGTAGEVAAAVLALHDLAWVTGAILPADGGLSLHSPIDSYGAGPDGTRTVS